eukprot:18460-Rhodomonas_salina.1
MADSAQFASSARMSQEEEALLKLRVRPRSSCQRSLHTRILSNFCRGSLVTRLRITSSSTTSSSSRD